MKKDITEALNAVTEAYQEKMSRSVELLRQDLHTSVEKVTEKRLNVKAKEFKQSKEIVKIASSASRRMSSVPVDGVYRKPSVFDMNSNPLWGRPRRNAKENARSNTDVDDNMDDLQDILDVTANLTTKLVKSKDKQKRRGSGFMQSSFLECNESTSPSYVENIEQEWQDDVNSPQQLSTPDEKAAFRVEGYIKIKWGNKNKPRLQFQRRFCVLSRNNMLKIYKRKKDVSDHVSSASGHIDLSSAEDICQTEDALSVRFGRENDTLYLQPYTLTEKEMWFNTLTYLIREGSGDVEDNMESMLDEQMYTCKKPAVVYRSMLGSGGKFSDIDSIDQLPLHSGYIAKLNKYKQKEYVYLKLEQTGALFQYKEAPELNGRRSNTTVLFSLSDVLSVTHSEEDMCFFEVCIKDRCFRFEGDSYGCAYEWHDVFVKWMKYFTTLSNASLQQSLASIEVADPSGSMMPVELNQVEMVRRRYSNDLQYTNDDVATKNKQEKMDYILVKEKTSLFSSARWQRRWIHVDSLGILKILTDRPNLADCGENAIMRSICMSEVLSIDISAKDACCFYIHEKGKHLKLKAENFNDAVAWRNFLLNMIMRLHSVQPDNDTEIPDISTRDVVEDVMDDIIESVVNSSEDTDEFEIEPFSRISSMFRPLESGLNPLETFLKNNECGEAVRARRSTKQAKNEFVELILAPRNSIREEVRDRINSAADDVVKNRRGSDVENRRFIKMNSTVDEDDFANKLKTQSYQDLNKEFWTRHKWYLTAVVCFVTLNVLSVTSYMIRETDF